MQAAQSTFISSTMWTERVGPTAALATIKKHKRLLMQASHLMDYWKSSTERVGFARQQNNGLNIDVSGIPPLSHFSFKDENI